MKLSNTLIMNCSVMPSKKAFTLAEVLITLSILGVVAALTIPSLVNRQQEMAAIVKLKKAISQFEQVTEVYMAENEATDMEGMVRSTSSKTNCDELSKYFKVVGGGGCDFTTADGVHWLFDSDGSAVVVYDSASSPKYGVAMVAKNGAANRADATSSDISGISLDSTSGVKVFTAKKMLGISKPTEAKSAAADFS